MDTITQGLLGAATAQLGFRQRIGRDATWVAAAAGVLPDLDIFIAPLLSLTGHELDSFASLRYHRGLSHSLLFAPVLSLPVAALWWRLRRRSAGRGAQGDSASQRPPPFRLLYLCVLVAVFTHPLLDWCTSYGTRLLDPLTNARYAIDAAPIVDLIYTPLLIATLLACWVARKIGRGRAPRATLVIGWLGFLASVGYLAAGRVLHDRAAAKAAGLVGRERVVRADAYPATGSIFLWRAVVETDDAWHAVRVHHFSGAPPERWRRTRAAKAPPNEWIERARELPEYEIYDWFAAGRLRAAYRRVDGVHVVEFHDMRYSLGTDGVESLWPLVVEFDAAGRAVFVGRRTGPRRGDFRKFAGDMWRDLWNP
jgi:inner membrane protein